MILSLELSPATLAFLGSVGDPADVLARLADSAANGARDARGKGREATDKSLRAERHNIDHLLGNGNACEEERSATNRHLEEERAYADVLHMDQREANSQMIVATIRAQELHEEADLAKQSAQRNEQELRTVAEFREMFIGILGHDLRTPLGGISMAAHLLTRRGLLDDSQTDLVMRITRSADRITRMISQLLDLTRTRLGGGMPIERARVDLKKVCKRVVEEFHVPIEIETEGDLVGSWDGDRLEEVFSNLTSNAIEYATEGTTVQVTARGERDGVVLEVANLGEAIPAGVLPFIFEPFRRARQLETSKAGNLGLGLYIAHQIVMAHGGSLVALSTGGRTTFTIRLPRAEPDAPSGG